MDICSLFWLARVKLRFVATIKFVHFLLNNFVSPRYFSPPRKLHVFARSWRNLFFFLFLSLPQPLITLIVSYNLPKMTTCIVAAMDFTECHAPIKGRPSSQEIVSLDEKTAKEILWRINGHPADDSEVKDLKICASHLFKWQDKFEENNSRY